MARPTNPIIIHSDPIKWTDKNKREHITQGYYDTRGIFNDKLRKEIEDNTNKRLNNAWL